MKRKTTNGSSKRRGRSSSSNPSRSFPGEYGHRRPVDSMDAMDIRFVNFIQLVFLLAAVPFVIIFLAVDSYAKKVRRKTYFAKERERRIELADGKRMKLCEYASVEEIIEGEDGQFYVIDKNEYARRKRLAQDRRKVRKHQTMNKMPTADDLKEQWSLVKRSHEDMLRFGSMLCDLEAYVDNSLLRDENGEIIGRRPGVKGWLGFNCPDIYRHYKKAMRYKQLAVKARQVIDMCEPYPLTVALGDEIPDSPETSLQAGDDFKASETTDGTTCGNGIGGHVENVDDEVVDGGVSGVGEGHLKVCVSSGGRVDGALVFGWRRKLKTFLLLAENYDLGQSKRFRMAMGCKRLAVVPNEGVGIHDGIVASDCKHASRVTYRSLARQLEGRLSASVAFVRMQPVDEVLA